MENCHRTPTDPCGGGFPMETIWKKSLECQVHQGTDTRPQGFDARALWYFYIV